MVPEAQLRDLLASADLRQVDRALLLLAAKDPAAVPVKIIRELGKTHGLRSASTFNISGHLSNSKGLAISTPAGWALTKAGRDHIALLLRRHSSLSSPVVVSTLRYHASTLASPDIAAFVHEAVICLETNQLRAATVLSWVGAVAVLHDRVLAHHCAEFNAEGSRRDAKWRMVKSQEDLARIKEFDFLQIACATGVFGRDVKQELEGCLKLRNSCGHPNSLKIGESRVAAHIETLVLNVFQYA